MFIQYDIYRNALIEHSNIVITSVRMYVCVSAPQAIKNYSREMKSE